MTERWIEDIEYIEVVGFKGLHEVRGNKWRVHSHRDEGKKRIYLLERITWNTPRAESWREAIRRQGRSS